MLAVPGEITSSLSAGTNALSAWRDTRDVCGRRARGLRNRAEPRRRRSLGATAETILARLRDGGLTGDEVVRASGVEPGAGAARSSSSSSPVGSRSRTVSIASRGI